jgi:hypothetical protein
VIEQARRAKDQVQAEESAEAGVAPAVKAEVLVQDLAGIASALAVVNGQCINWESPAINRGAQNVVRL